MALSRQYVWLSKEPGPKMILEAMALFGTVEAAASKDNPKILACRRCVGYSVHHGIERRCLRCGWFWSTMEVNWPIASYLTAQYLRPFVFGSLLSLDEKTKPC